MTEEFLPEDDNESQKHIRKLIKIQINMEDDSLFTKEDLETILRNMNYKRAPGKDGIRVKYY